MQTSTSKPLILNFIHPIALMRRSTVKSKSTIILKSKWQPCNLRAGALAWLAVVDYWLQAWRATTWTCISVAWTRRERWYWQFIFLHCVSKLQTANICDSRGSPHNFADMDEKAKVKLSILWFFSTDTSRYARAIFRITFSNRRAQDPNPRGLPASTAADHKFFCEMEMLESTRVLPVTPLGIVGGYLCHV